MQFNLKKLAVAFIVLPVLSVPIGAQIQAKAIKDISNQKVDMRQLREAVASRTLTWLTGSSSNNDYISVGRSANFFGFVALRVSSGHSLTRSRVARDTLAVLNDDQQTSLISILNAQKKPFEQTQAARFEMNRALEGLLVGEQISQKQFLELGRAYGASEANLGRVIGQKLGEIVQTLSSDQQSKLSDIRAAHVSGQGGEPDQKGIKLRISKQDKQELVNLAARLLSWTTGSQEFNDFEVVGKPSQHFGFVSLRMESNHGVRRGEVAKKVLNLLTPNQRAKLDTSAELNRQQFDFFLQTRGQLMRQLETALDGGIIDVSEVTRLGSDVGEIEANMTWAQAVAMLDVRNSLSEEQSSQLLEMRAKYTGSAQVSSTTDPFERGRQLFAQCALCHTAQDGRAIGPDLSGIIGRKIAADSTYQFYSPALRDFSSRHEEWTETQLDDFLQSPKSLVPGTTMGFDGFESEADRAAIIAYLQDRR